MSEHVSQVIRNTLSDRTERTFEQWLEGIEGENGRIIREQIMTDPEISTPILTAPGSRGAHQGFRGGYAEHVRQTMMIASHLYELMVTAELFDQLPEEEHFTESDALLVLFLHDIEKPFMFRIEAEEEVINHNPMTKSERKTFRTDFIKRFNIQLNARHENALDFVEGVRDHLYIPGQRADKPLAALCHAADNTSARAFYQYDASSR